MGGTWTGRQQGHRARLEMIVGPLTCPTCLERKDSQLHRELCEAGEASPVPSADGRCGKCGYLLVSPGHRAACGLWQRVT